MKGCSDYARNMYKYSFEKLDVWQESKDLVISLYKITSDYPANEKFGITSQIRRASTSICSNLAEGSAYNSYKHQAHYSTLAFGSAMEVINQLILCNE